MRWSHCARRSFTCWWLFAGAAASAQVTTGDIIGRVIDSGGNGVPAAVVVVTNTETGASRQFTTSDAGEYSFPMLSPGRYRLQVDRGGFQRFTADVALASGDRQRLDARLHVAGIVESVSVSATSTLVQSESATVGFLVARTAIDALPVSGRNLVNLITIQPGVNDGLPTSLASGNRPDDRRQSSSMSVNGQNDVLNNNLIDGVDNNGRSVGSIGVRPSMEAVSEVRLQANVYSAEEGRTAGGVVNVVTKSGTNRFAGSSFAFLRNERFDARNFFAPVDEPKPTLRQYQYGGSLGGPIRRDHSFFFGDYERFSSTQGVPFISTVPSERMRTGDFSELLARGVLIYDPTTASRQPFPGNVIPANRIDAVGHNLLLLYPHPTSSGLANNYKTVRDRTQASHTWDGRVDHQLGSGDTLYARYSGNLVDTFVPGVFAPTGGIETGGAAASFGGPSKTRADHTHINYLKIFRPTLLAELKAAYLNLRTDSLPLTFGRNVATALGLPGVNAGPLSSGLPNVPVAGYTTLGDATFLPLLQRNETWQLRATLTAVRGSHDVKWGVGVVDRGFRVAQSNQPAGLFTFTRALTDDGRGGGGDAAAAMLLGFPSQESRINVLVDQHLRTWEIGAFVQDDWRVTAWLTANLGVRYDIFTALTEADRQLSNLDLQTFRIQVAGDPGVSDSANIPTDYGNVAPRLGAAAKLGRGLVLRGGYGVSYFPSQVGSNAFLRNPPFAFVYGPVTSAGASGSRPTIRLSDGLPPPTVPDTSQVSGTIFAVDTGLRPTRIRQYNLILEKQLGAAVAQVGYIGSSGDRLWLSIPNLNYAPPGPGPIGPRRPYAALAPNLGTLTYQTSRGVATYDALQLAVHRRAHRGLTLGSSYVWAHGISNATQPGGGGAPQAYGVIPGAIDTVERSSSDIDIRHRWAMYATYDLPFARDSSGVRRAFVHGWQLSGIAFWQSGLPFTVVNATPRSNTGVGANGDRPDRICSGHAAHPTIDAWFDTSCFVPQPLNTVGNSGRNILYGPPQRRLDLAVAKNVVMRYGYIQVRVECFNATNTPSFGVPNASLGSPTFGTVTTTANAQPRQMQFAAKYVF